MFEVHFMRILMVLSPVRTPILIALGTCSLLVLVMVDVLVMMMMMMVSAVIHLRIM